MQKPILVLKFGTASITKTSGEPDNDIITEIAKQVSKFHQNHNIVIVSSGAVGAGKKYIQNYEGNISQKKAAAAIGNPLLLKMYSEAFAKFNINVAQSLLERQHFAKREQFLQLKETYEELWKSNIIPIANENDVVSNRELKFSDNDELAALVASGFGAERLMLCTVSGGLMDKNNEIVSEIKQIDEEVMSMVNNSKSALGSGGMSSKLTFTNLANKMGIKVTIFGMKKLNGIIEAFHERAGSTFLPQKINISAKNKWMASAGLSVARIIIDAGAEKAILNRKSLLAVGIKNIEGEFQKGEIVEICNENNQQIAVGKSRLSNQKLDSIKDKTNIVIIHVDDVVLL